MLNNSLYLIDYNETEKHSFMTAQVTMLWPYFTGEIWASNESEKKTNTSFPPAGINVYLRKKPPQLKIKIYLFKAMLCLKVNFQEKNSIRRNTFSCAR